MNTHECLTEEPPTKQRQSKFTSKSQVVNKNSLPGRYSDLAHVILAI